MTAVRGFRYEMINVRLTVEAHRPLRWLVPSPVIKASDIVFRHILVYLKVEVLILAGVADIPLELCGLAIPLKSKESFLRRFRRVEASNPLAGVKAVVQSPCRVPVTSHPTLVVVFSSLRVQKLPCKTTLVS